MCAFRSNYSNHVEFVLSSDLFKPIVLTEEPEGWSEDGLEYSRHEDYHGIFFSFTNDLVFYKEARDYIDGVYRELGVNAKLVLTKKILLDDGDGDLKLTEVYNAYADFKTLNYTSNSLRIKFNSNDLAELLKSHEDDKFEVERLTTIDDETIPTFETSKLNISARNLLSSGEGEYLKEQFSVFGSREQVSYFSLATNLISQGPPRFSSVDKMPTGIGFNVGFIIGLGLNTLTASNLFYVNSSNINETVQNLEVDYDFNFLVSTLNHANTGGQPVMKASFWVVSYDDVSDNYTLGDETNIFSSVGSMDNQNLIANGTYSVSLNRNQGLVFAFNHIGRLVLTPIKSTLKLREVTVVEDSSNLTFAFYHDVWSRIIRIITGRNDAFYSKFLGRKELGYTEDGVAGLIGLISGFWVRAFIPSSDKYKSLTTSHKDLLESADAVFAVGLGIETVGFSERVRVEPVEYFYQEQVVIILSEGVYEEKIKIIPNAFYSGLELGYRRGGDYEDEQGLDEPNTRANWVTPIRKSSRKYRKLSRFRSDEYGLERLRRKPQLNFPDEDTRGDSDNWLLDIKRGNIIGSYKQKIWSDRLSELPIGVFSPETYKTAFFTPLRMMFRHAKLFMDGIEPYRNRLITYANGVANVVLRTKFIGESKSYQENEDVPVSDLDRALFMPEEFIFRYAYSDDLFNLINGKTQVLVGGEVEQVPNVYFPMSFIDSRGENRIGYIFNVKITDDIEFTVRLANTNIIN